jgi:hypothetical protein
MISSTLSDDGTVRFATRLRGAGPDQNFAENTRFSLSELAGSSKIRAEVISRGRILAADPTYPSVEVLRKVAERILVSGELKGDHS